MKFLDTDKLIPHEEVDLHKIKIMRSELAAEYEMTGEDPLHNILPIAITPLNDKYLILDGHHRAFIFKEFKEKIPAVIFEDYFLFDIEVRGGVIGENKVRHTITKEEIILRAMIGQLFKPKSTRHYYNGKAIIKTCKEEWEKNH